MKSQTNYWHSNPTKFCISEKVDICFPNNGQMNPSNAYICLYICHYIGSIELIIMISRYEILLVAPSNSVLVNANNILSKRFKMTGIGIIKFYLGI